MHHSFHHHHYHHLNFTRPSRQESTRNHAISLSFFSFQVNDFNADLNLIVLEVVTAISKMGTFNPSYFTELLTDSGEFNTRAPTKHQLKQKFHGWRQKLRTLAEGLASLIQSSHYKSLSFKRQLEIAYISIAGEIEKHITDEYARKYKRENIFL